jgi:uncharacterized protein YacL (UPF0231 family)
MEYEFLNDSLTGVATARFSMEHEIMGPWLEVEVGKSIPKLTKLLETIADVKTRQQQDVQIIGMEYTLIFGEDSVQVMANRDFEHDDEESNELQEGLMTDHDGSAECGIEDFKMLLMTWSNFIK